MTLLVMGLMRLRVSLAPFATQMWLPSNTKDDGWVPTVIPVPTESLERSIFFTVLAPWFDTHKEVPSNTTPIGVSPTLMVDAALVVALILERLPSLKFATQMLRPS